MESFLEAQCYLCKKKFQVSEGTDGYKLIKNNRKGMHACEDCKSKIELEAKLNVGKRLISWNE